MFRPLALCIGLRYARSRRDFISFVTALALGGLALSVAILLFVQAIVAGFERELRHRVLGVVPHLTVTGYAPLTAPTEALTTLRRVDGVAAASAVVEGLGLLASARAVAGVNLTGVLPSEYAAVSRVFEFTDLAEPLAPGTFRVAVGARAAARLDVGVGDTVSAVLPQASVTPLGVFARQKKLLVAGLVDTGSQLDRHSAYLHRDDAARLFRLGDAVHGFHARVADPLDAGGARRGALAALGAARVRASTWQAILGDLAGAIRVTRNMLFLLLSLLVGVAAFNLVSSLVMIVKERRSDVAMLRTIGANGRLIVGGFVVLGLAISVVGVALGLVGGVALGLIAEAGFPWLERLLGTPLMSEYLVNALPVRFTAGDIGRVVATALALCLAATALPAWRAARLQPAEVLRHE